MSEGHKFYGVRPVATPMVCPDPVVEANRELLLQRSLLGIRKYGVTLESAGLSHRALLQHALEEALDLANYLQAAIRDLDSKSDDGK